MYFLRIEKIIQFDKTIALDLPSYLRSMHTMCSEV